MILLCFASLCFYKMGFIQRSRASKAGHLVCFTNGRSERPNVYCAAVTVYSCD